MIMIYGIFGLPRCGKTTYLCGIAKKYIKKGVPVYTNFECKGALKVKFDDLGKYNFENCCILLDEISMECDSRNWKSFQEHSKYFFSHHGHYNVDIYYCSQWLSDADIKIRRLTQDMYYISRLPFGFSAVYKVIRDITTADNGDIVDTYEFKRPRLFWRPRYYKMFDSYVRKKLPEYPKEYW